MNCLNRSLAATLRRVPSSFGGEGEVVRGAVGRGGGGNRTTDTVPFLFFGAGESPTERPTSRYYQRARMSRFNSWHESTTPLHYHRRRLFHDQRRRYRDKKKKRPIRVMSQLLDVNYLILFVDIIYNIKLTF